ncbi:phi PVL/orf 52-like protein [Staphylococcus aureus]|nr:phi PVL/orf 52-like protein [Staphylococcus aureus]CAC6081499.1 phi PVL/orf 52-like protein [Staphylococcus aureus]CAC6135055.1 phi PVL/orf 52-like protein [Staphylococcus aureus]CAC6162495.1 phi PVL/orf 52-like protein [Staphylococcus aureus]CAC8015000.1 phi PVL/orf 52-like protein [Staphylococcus aureus]
MNYETGFQLSVMDARLKKMRKQRDEYKKQRDELIGDMTEVKRKAKAFDEIDNLMNNREQIEQSVISASAYNGNDTEGLLKEIEDVYKKAQAFDRLLEDINNFTQSPTKGALELDEAIGIMVSQVIYEYKEQEDEKI